VPVTKGGHESQAAVWRRSQGLAISRLSHHVGQLNGAGSNPPASPVRLRLSRLRWPQLLVIALCLGFGLALTLANVQSWELEDAEAYWNAAIRLRQGQDLYIPAPAVGDEMIAYRYAPWLAWLWVPLTLLPKGLVQVVWSALLVTAVAVSLAPLVRARSVAALCLLGVLGGLLIRTASTGNVHALMIAALVWGIPRRSGPLWIGLAASVKVAPILYALVYAGRREWWRMAASFGVGAILWAPVLLYDLSRYPTDPGESFSLLSVLGPIPWIIAAGVCAASVFVVSRTRYAWVAGSVAVLAAVPRLALYDLTYLLAWREGDSQRQARPRSLRAKLKSLAGTQAPEITRAES
jgi:hypothetical protein